MDHKQYHLIQTQIEAARNALHNWNDRRAEAMIELDSVFTEIEAYKAKTTEEYEAAQSTIIDLRAALSKSELDFHHHFKNFTNEMQELKLANENLTRELKETSNEIENQKQAQKKMEAKHITQIAQVASETEIRLADQQFQLKTQVTNLVSQLQNTLNEKKVISQKADQYESELRTIRTQMMSFLHITKEVVATETITKNASAAALVNAANSGIVNAPNANHAGASVSDANANEATAIATKKLREFEASSSTIANNPLPTTVNDYLKRFGY